MEMRERKSLSNKKEKQKKKKQKRKKIIIINVGLTTTTTMTIYDSNKGRGKSRKPSKMSSTKRTNYSPIKTTAGIQENGPPPTDIFVVRASRIRSTSPSCFSRVFKKNKITDDTFSKQNRIRFRLEILLAFSLLSNPPKKKEKTSLKGGSSKSFFRAFRDIQ